VILLSLFFYFYGTGYHEVRASFDGDRWYIGNLRLEGGTESFSGIIELTNWYPGESGPFQKRAELIFKSIEYRKGGLVLRAGSFYELLGKGLILGATEDDVALLRRFLNGFKLSYSKERLNTHLFFGKPCSYIYYKKERDSTDVVGGAAIYLPFGRRARLSSYYLQILTESMKRRRITHMVGIGPSLSLGVLNLSFEGVLRWGWNRYEFSDTLGAGFHLLFELSKEKFASRLELKNYDLLGTPHSLPPPVNHYGVTINNGRDEKGVELALLMNPLADLFIETDFSFNWGEGTLSESFSKIDYLSDMVEVSLSFDKLTTRGVESLGGYSKWDETSFEAGSNFSLKGGFGIGTGIRIRKRIEEFKIYTDSDFQLSFSFFPLLDISLFYEKRRGDENNQWKRIEFQFHLGSNIDFFLSSGSQREDIVCSGGVCRPEPAFKGHILKLIFRY